MFLFQLPTAEGCNDTNFNICGGDQSKYPTDSINRALNRNEDLKSAVLTLRKFFGPQKPQFRTAEVETLDKLACTATRKKIPRDARAKNINGNKIYLTKKNYSTIQFNLPKLNKSIRSSWSRGSVPSSHARGHRFEPQRRQYFKLLLDPGDFSLQSQRIAILQ